MKLFDLFATITLDSSKFERGLTDASNRLNSTASSIKSFGQSAMNSMNGLVSALAKVASAAALVKAGEYVVKTGVSYTATLEEYTAQLSVLLGGANAANTAMEDLAEMAAKTPYELKDVASAATSLLTVGVSTDEVTDYVRRLGDISLGSSEKLESLTAAFMKTKSQGKLTTEVLRTMQFNGFDPLNMIAEKYGLTQEAVNQALADGVIPASELEWAIKKATDEGGQFFNGSATLAETLNGKIGTLSENWQAFLGKLTEPVSETLNGTVLPYAIGLVDELTAALDEDGIQGVLSTVKTEVESLGGTIVSKITEYFDGEQAVADLQALTGTIASLIAGGSVTVTNVLSFLTGMLGKITEALSDETVLANLASITTGIITGILTFDATKFTTIFEGLTFFSDFMTSLISGIADTVSSENISTKVSAIVTNLFTAIGTWAGTYLANLPELITACSTIAEALITGIASGLSDALSTFVDAIFGTDEEKKQEAITSVETWCSDMLAALGLEWNWEESAIYKGIEAIKSAVNAIGDGIATAKEAISNFFTNLQVSLEDSPIYVAINAVKSAIDSVIGAAQSAIGWVKELLGIQSGESGESSGGGIIDGVVGAAENAVNWVKGLFGGGSGESGEGSGSMVVYDEPIGPARPHATGLYSVPFDNYPALLHKGEQVLTRAQANEYRDGGNQTAGNQNFVINIQSTAESPSETAAYIRQAMRNLRFT